MATSKQILGIIPARGGSKGIPRKNIIDVAGYPLIYYTIKEAKESSVFDKLIVSTDNLEIAQVSKKYGVEIPFLRPPEFASDTATTEMALRHVLAEFRRLDYEPDIFCILQPTSPFRTAQDIISSVMIFQENGFTTLTAFSEMEDHPEYEFEISENLKAFPVYPQLLGIRRQDLKKHYKINGALYICDTKYFLSTGKLYSENHGAYIMPKERALDIDTPEDLELCRILMAQTKKHFH